MFSVEPRTMYKFSKGLTQNHEKLTMILQNILLKETIYLDVDYSKLRPTFEPDYSTLEQTSFFQNSFVQKRTYCGKISIGAQVT
jgi:hypothetical protein